MDDSPTVPSLIAFEDRRTGLIAFGLFEIFLGCLCALLVPFMIWGQMMSAQMTGGAANLRMVIPGALVYGLLAVAFVWLGIGSMRCRRWARALLLILSWSWLGMGVIAIGLLLASAPKMMASVPPSAYAIAIAMVAVIWTLGFIVVPAALVAFYQSRQVKATCDARDPVGRWTDGCPLPVLAVAIWLGFGAVSMLAMAITYSAVLPCFGILLSGLPGTLAFLFLTALWGYLAWAWYRRRPAAWWITLAAIVVFAASSIVTFTQVDLMDMYRLMGYPPEQIAMIQQYNFVTARTMVWWSAAFMLPMIGYLIWVKRFFRGSPAGSGAQ